MNRVADPVMMMDRAHRPGVVVPMRRAGEGGGADATQNGKGQTRGNKNLRHVNLSYMMRRSGPEPELR